MGYVDGADARPVVNRSEGAQAGLDIGRLTLHHSVGPLEAAFARFNTRAQSASAHFGNPLDPSAPLVQWVDDNDVAWAQVDGNWPWTDADGHRWAAISIENESLAVDIPETSYDDVWAPLNGAQLERVVVLCRYYHETRGFPLQVSDDPAVPGLVYHSMNPPSWGTTGCPGQPIVDQRAEIIARALALGTPVEEEDMRYPIALLRSVETGEVFATGGQRRSYLASGDHVRLLVDLKLVEPNGSTDPADPNAGAVILDRPKVYVEQIPLDMIGGPLAGTGVTAEQVDQIVQARVDAAINATRLVRG